MKDCLKKCDGNIVKVASTIAVTVILFFALNVIGNSSLKQYDVDFTEDNIFALSKTSKDIIRDIAEPVTLRFFYSRQSTNGFPALKSHAERIRAVLERYVSASHGKIKLQVIDPEAYTDDEDLAVGYGIKGIDLNNGAGDKLYLGLAISNSRDDTRAIPFFHPDRQRFVEYEITKAVYDLIQQKRPVIGLLTSLEMISQPMLGIPGLGGGQGWLFLEQLKQGFEISVIEKAATSIPDNIDVLLIAQPNGFNPELLFAIDQYVLKGGKTVVFADPNREGVVASGNQEDRAYGPEFTSLLSSWGVEISRDTIVTDRNAARQTATGAEAQGKVDNISALSIGQDGLSPDDITTSLLKNINFSTAGSINDLKTGMSVTPLIHTSTQSMRINVSVIKGAPDANMLLSNFVPDNKEYTLAARISGKAKSAYPHRASEPGILGESKGDINLVVVADTDLLRDDSWAKLQDIQGYKVAMQNADNGPFVNNIMELMSGSNELIALRGRGAASHPFTVVEDIKKKAEERYLAKEKELKDRLAATEAQLADLKRQADSQAGDKLAYQSQQQQAIAAFTDQMVQIRKELRGVQHELKKDVDRLGSILKFLNIILMPLLISMFAVFVFVFRGMQARK